MLKRSIEEASESLYPNFSLEEYLEDQGITFRKKDAEDHVEFAMNCPNCVDNGEARPDTKQRLWINSKTGAFYCYNCGWDGPLPRLVQHFSNTDYMGAIKILRGKQLNPLEHLNFKLAHQSADWSDQKKIKTVVLPHGFESFEEAGRDTKYHDYLKKRGIPLSYAIKMGWGFSDFGYTKNRIIVPSYIDDHLVFWQARDVLDEKHEKWGTSDYRKVLNPKGISARHVLYGYDKAQHYERIYICEGFIDAAKAGYAAVAINSKTLHHAQVELLCESNAKQVYLLLDDDAYNDEKRYVKGPKAGKLKTPSSVKRAVKMLKPYFEVKCIRFPKGRDAGSYEIKTLQKLLNKL
jgi:hypothetical protein